MQVLSITFLETVHEELLPESPDHPYAALAFAAVAEGSEPDDILEALLAYCREFLNLPEWITDDAIRLAGRYECFAAAPTCAALPDDEHVAVFRVSWGPWYPDA